MIKRRPYTESIRLRRLHTGLSSLFSCTRPASCMVCYYLFMKLKYCSIILHLRKVCPGYNVGFSMNSKVLDNNLGSATASQTRPILPAGTSLPLKSSSSESRVTTAAAPDPPPTEEYPDRRPASQPCHENRSASFQWMGAMLWLVRDPLLHQGFARSN